MIDSVNCSFYLSQPQFNNKPLENNWIGKGEKGWVFLQVAESGERFAVKQYFTSVQWKQMGYPSEVYPYFFDEEGRCKLGIMEFEIGQQLDHPNIMKVEDLYFEEIDGQIVTFLKMEYILGKNLGDVSSYSLDQQCCLQAIKDAAGAFGHAFSRGFIHEDLYDSNVMLTEDGQIKLIDLESFTLLGPESADEEQTVGEYAENLAFFFQSVSRKGRFSTEMRKRIDAAIKDRLKQMSRSEAVVSKEQLLSLADAMLQLEKAIDSISLTNESATIPKHHEESVSDVVGFASKFAFSLAPCPWAMVARSKCKF